MWRPASDASKAARIGKFLSIRVLRFVQEVRHVSCIPSGTNLAFDRSVDRLFFHRRFVGETFGGSEEFFRLVSGKPISGVHAGNKIQKMRLFYEII